jgi:hypothetical protein
MMMAEKNNREVLQPLIDWMNKNVTGSNNQAPAPRRQAGDSLALKVADFSSFWVGTEHKTMPVRHHRSGADVRAEDRAGAAALSAARSSSCTAAAGRWCTTWGLGGGSGWAHHFVQAGYTVYLVDRPGHGRSVYHPDALGEIGPLVTYDLLTRDTGHVGARHPTSSGPAPPATWAIRSSISWSAAANSTPRNGQLAQDLWRRYGRSSSIAIGPVRRAHALGRRSVSAGSSPTSGRIW